jgi:hypothetical protein
LNKEQMSSPIASGDDVLLGGYPPDLSCGKDGAPGRLLKAG